MKVKWLFICIVILMLFGLSCSKSNTATSTNATMSATVNGTPTTFNNVTVSYPSGHTVVQGTSNRYTLTLYLNSTSASVFTLAAQSTGYYATVTDNTGYNYSTDPANTGQITLTLSGNLYNGTFYFTANETSPIAGGGSITVTNGSCTNI